jgi:hypothetical protein
MKEIKKQLINQKEALKFETRYKKLKFTGKYLNWRVFIIEIFRETQSYSKDGKGNSID